MAAEWTIYPTGTPLPAWAEEMVGIFSDEDIASERVHLKSDQVLSKVASYLKLWGFSIEAGKAADQKLSITSETGRTVNVDAFNRQDGIVVEVEAVRAVLGNAIYRDIINMSLIDGVRWAVVAVPKSYAYKRGRSQPYSTCVSLMKDIYASRRLQLPFEGFLLIGY